MEEWGSGFSYSDSGVQEELSLVIPFRRITGCSLSGSGKSCGERHCIT